MIATERDALLAAILAAPEDDAPRLIDFAQTPRKTGNSEWSASV